MSYSLECSKCGKKFSPKDHIYNCENCGGVLNITYPYDSLRSKIDRDTLETRKGGIWKYSELLPILNKTKVYSLREGNTTLQRCDKLSPQIGIKNLYAKDETNNPTGSFKDRASAVGVCKSAEFGAKGIVVASDGNVAPSASAYSTAAGLRCLVFMPEYVNPNRITQTMMYGAKMFVVQGNINDCIDLAAELKEKRNWHHLSTVTSENPYHIEGTKTIVYEICEQLDWATPDWIVTPMGGGGLMTANWKGLKEFLNLGLIESLPKMAGVQAEGCKPIVEAYKRGDDIIKRWDEDIKTEAIPIAVPYPIDGKTALESIRDSEGTVISVSDEEIIKSIKLLAENEAIIAEPAGAVSFAGTVKMVEEGIIDEEDTVVFEVTGTGFRELERAQELLERPIEIEAEIEKVEDWLK